MIAACSAHSRTHTFAGHTLFRSDQNRTDAENTKDTCLIAGPDVHNIVIYTHKHKRALTPHLYAAEQKHIEFVQYGKVKHVHFKKY